MSDAMPPPPDPQYGTPRRSRARERLRNGSITFVIVLVGLVLVFFASANNFESDSPNHVPHILIAIGTLSLGAFAGYLYRQPHRRGLAAAILAGCGATLLIDGLCGTMS